MKVITNNAAYIQRYELILFIQSGFTIPEGILSKLKNSQNAYDFIKFEKPEERMVINNLAWVADYDDLKNLSEDNIKEMIRNLTEEAKKLIEGMAFMTKAERRQNYNLERKYKLINIKISSLKEFLALKKQYVSYDLPEGLELIPFPVEDKNSSRILNKH